MTKTNGMGQAEVLTPEQLDLLIENLPEVTHRVVACVMRYCASRVSRSAEHTSELQLQPDLVCRLLPEKKKHNDYIERFDLLPFLVILLFELPLFSFCLIAHSHFPKTMSPFCVFFVPLLYHSSLHFTYKPL
mgnify:CR=1 FL=1